MNEAWELNDAARAAALLPTATPIMMETPVAPVQAMAPTIEVQAIPVQPAGQAAPGQFTTTLCDCGADSRTCCAVLWCSPIVLVCTAGFEPAMPSIKL